MQQYLMFPPVTVSIETTTVCNANCMMCPHERIICDGLRRRKVMPTEDVYKILDMIDWDCEIQWAWINEPLAEPRLVEFVKATTDKGMRSIINTNGQLLTKDKAEQLFEAGITLINFSIDSAIPHTYSKIRENLDFNTVYKNYKNAVEIRNNGKYDTQIWVSRAILPKLNDNIIEAKRFKSAFKCADHIQTNAYRKRGGGTDENVCLPTPKKNYCWFLENDVSISVDGDVPLCSCDACSTTVTGNVFETPLLEIWNSRVRHKVAMGIRRNGMDWFKNCRETA